MAKAPKQAARPARETTYQSYAWTQRLRAAFYGRAQLFIESAVAVALLVAVVVVDTIYLLNHGDRDVLQAVADTLSLLSLQGSGQNGAKPGLLLLLFNVLFSVLLVQTLLNSARALIVRRTPQVRQLGMASVCNRHVIVCGLGRLGLRVATRLVESGYAAVVVEKDWSSEFVPRALAMQVPVVTGDARDPQVLRAAGLRRAVAVVAGIDDDLLDVEIALAARTEAPGKRVILRAFSEDFDQALEASFGPDTAFSVSRLGAPTFAAASISRAVEHVLPLDDELLPVSDIVVPAESRLPATVEDLERMYRIRVVAHVNRAKHPVSMRSARNLSEGDQITIIGTLEAHEAVHGLLPTGAPGALPAPPLLPHPTAELDTVVVCGHGKVGYRVVRWLLNRPSPPRIVVVHQPGADTLFPAEIQALGVEEVIGDARDPAILRQAHLERAFAIAAVTSDDLTNLRIGMEARRLRGDVHVVLRVFSDNLAENLVDLFGIHTAFSTSDLASSTLAAAAEIGDVDHAFSTEGRLFALDRLAAGERLAGASVETVRKEHGAVVIGLSRGGALTTLPGPGERIAQGDGVWVVATLAALRALRRA
jgi:Trk K+ transport system NAD-binding subunit